MLKTNLMLVVIISLFSSATAQERTANPEDVKTIGGLINAYYESVSGPPGLRDGERMLSLFIKGGKVKINVDGEEPTHDVAETYLRNKSFLTISTDFYEREIGREAQQFGNMAHVLSAYGISDAMENKDYTARGVTMFQLVKQNDRWWILSTLWQRESEDNPIPSRLLND